MTETKISRFNEIECCKSLAMLGLPLVHTFECFNDFYSIEPSAISYCHFFIALTILGPSIFMICMGFGMSSPNTQPKVGQYLKHGYQFLLIAFILDLIRYGIPLIIDYFVTNNSIIEFFDSKIFYSDIYYFVGLYFIFLSILKKYKISDYSIFLITILTISINTLLFEHLKDLPIISKIFLGHFAYIDQDSCFPLLTWAIFPTIGLLIGNKMKKCENSEEVNKQYTNIASLSLVIFLALAVEDLSFDINIFLPLTVFTEYYYSSISSTVLLVLIAFIYITVFRILCNKYANSFFIRFLSNLSPLILPFYFIQWVLVNNICYPIILILKARNIETSLGIGIGTSLFIFVLSILLVKKYGIKLMRFLLKITDIGKMFSKKKAKK